jgi:hypothetical protein
MNSRKRLWSCLLVSGIPFSACLPAAAAVFTVTQSAWGDATTTNSFAWALNQANTTPGLDTIDLQLVSGNTINVDYSTPVISSFLSRITEQVNILGNGVTLLGDPVFVSSGGVIFNKFKLGTPAGSDQIVRNAFSFAIAEDNVAVSIDNLSADGLNWLLEVGKNAVANVTNSVIKNTIFYGYSGQSVINALEGAVVNLAGVTLDRINPLIKSFPGFEQAWEGAITGKQATLNMVNSLVKGGSTSLGGVNWLGGTANVVSSIFTGSAGGLSIMDYAGQDGVLNFVNSLFRPESAASQVGRIQASDGGVVNLIASTIQADQLFIEMEVDCPTNPSWYGCNGSPLQVFDGGQIHLSQTVVSTINAEVNGIINPYSDTYLQVAAAGDLTADLLSYVQPTPSLNPAALQALFNQLGLLTGAIPYALTNGGLLYGELPEGA